ncbi:bifunctional 4-hydroxy-2-oxoglutarate aldolase/2-dehydro-3-deoxy-phosphogluconate aldolase [Leptolyngbya iicbica]|uniref:Bifunctional 4-hydroxy-2-oxoglutarate aldolase/2-dehydro-3-deoxy-phosphogluconate aldolase n=2 Tax=Cyanophyceae TaxID=3028117 RepID=A0A4Q7E0Z5_9CYAN|nr:bifunctional 4-hydroxy-2-oxoglutarate aldolase/2-dehydro-3-deoxy-phosphogluconate aldolase [Leptolyngbya sp. LK]RZM75054.1 bifunctional 4-hydroxy-2-oxoglutarate aldolase/2-dehydro-3-deoxy-phosphogluconate aldolase [Leptolyngbya sp. LK]
MKQAQWLTILRQHRAIAIIRAPSVSVGRSMAQAVVAAGFRLIEITWNSDRPAVLVQQLRSTLPTYCYVGVGTVLTPADMQTAIAAGAQFCFMPHTDAALLAIAQAEEIPAIPGALTPTEIMTAWQLGADSVKVFPCQSVGGPAYIRHLQGPLGHIPLIPTGGITVERGRDYLQQGAIAIGIASDLFPSPLVARQDWDAIRQRSQLAIQNLQL